MEENPPVNINNPTVQSNKPMMRSIILKYCLISLRKTLISSLKENGILILSGILEEQASDIIDAFKSDMFLSIIDQQEGWLLMKGKK